MRTVKELKEEKNKLLEKKLLTTKEIDEQIVSVELELRKHLKKKNDNIHKKRNSPVCSYKLVTN